MFQVVIAILTLPLYASEKPENKPATKPDSMLIKNVIALNDSGVYYWKKKEFQQALELFTGALHISEHNDLKNHIASVLNNIGLVHYSQGDYVQCLEYYNRSANILREIGDSMKIALILMNTGILYKKQALYDKATANLLEAANYFEAIGQDRSFASCLNTLANIQTDLGFFEDAFKYHFKALTIREKTGDTKGVAGSLNNIGSVYKSMDSLRKALEYYNKSLTIKNEIDDKALIASTLANIGEVYFLLNDYKNAEGKFVESFDLRSAINDRNGILSVSNKIAELYLKTGQTNKARTFLDNGYKIAKESQSNELSMDNFRLRSQLFLKNNNLDEAIKNFMLYDSVKTIILNKEKVKALTELRIKYETEKNESEIKNLNMIRETQAGKIDAQTKMQRALMFGLTMFLILTLVVFRAYRQKRKSNIQIRTLMQERQHRAKNNLQIIAELLGLQSAYLEHEQAKGAVKSGENRMQAVSLIDKMLYQNPDDTQIEMNEYTHKLVSNLAFLFDGKGRKVNINLHVGHFLLDAAKATPLGLILNELITNSFKYAFQECLSPELKIELLKNEGKQIMLIYSDNGPGLNKEIELSKINSLGLKLIHSLSRQLKGVLVIENRDGFYCNLTFKA
jgi:two-component sensor histidine kinase/Tfp pilus assembly protein PilF